MYTYHPDSEATSDQYTPSGTPYSPTKKQPPPLPPSKPPKPRRPTSNDSKHEELSPLKLNDNINDNHSMTSEPSRGDMQLKDRATLNRELRIQQESTEDVDVFSSMRSFQGRMYKRIILLTFFTLAALAMSIAALVILLKSHTVSPQRYSRAVFQAGLPTNAQSICVEQDTVVPFTTAWILEGFEMPNAAKFRCMEDGLYMFGMSVQVEDKKNAELNIFRQSPDTSVQPKVVCRMAAGERWGSSDNTKICYSPCHKGDLIFANSVKRESCLYGHCLAFRCQCTLFGQYVAPLPAKEKEEYS